MVGELACGRSAADRRKWQEIFQTCDVLPWTMEVSWQYGEIYRRLQTHGTPIGVNDLWIAATALAYDMAVVTNNVEEFRRVESLTVIPY